MQIFLSWSGEPSYVVAGKLKEWLPLVLAEAKPWLSTEDIQKGSQWQSNISEALAHTNVGIFCLTPSNLTAPWLIFEAGAVANATRASGGVACTYLIGVNNAEVPLPLGMFQSTLATRDDTFRLMQVLNARLQTPLPSDRVTKLFETFWPELAAAIDDAKRISDSGAPVRSDRELLTEIVETVRQLTRWTNETAAAASPVPSSVDLRDVFLAFGASSKLATPEVLKDLEHARRVVMLEGATREAMETAIRKASASVYTPMELESLTATLRRIQRLGGDEALKPPLAVDEEKRRD